MPSLETADDPNAYTLTHRILPDGHVAIVLTLFRDTLPVGSRTVAVVASGDGLMAKFEWHHVVAKRGLMRIDDETIDSADPCIEPDHPLRDHTALFLQAA